ncbi:hypothetical protein [Metabacillus dongyingensis]|uniref:hypothetical protein n=1 Tax=Metabacillus dongyingensis TaxID=2874282 RepID=UPI003BA15042
MDKIEIVLEKAIDSDADSIFDMQVKSFVPLLEKYKDCDTSPANETINRVIARIWRKNAIVISAKKWVTPYLV